MMDEVIDTPSQRPGVPIDLARLAAGLWRARWLLFAVAIVGCILGYVIAKVAMSPDYQAEAAMVWDPDDIRDAAAQHRKLRTLAASIELPKTLQEVKRRSGTSMSVDDMTHAIIADVRANSNLLLVYARTPDPQESADLVNLAIEVFIEQQRQAVRDQVQEIVDAAKRVRDAALQELQAARLAYDRFREKEGILDLRMERSAAIEKATILETTADHARADLQAQIERVRVLSQAKSRLTDTVVMSETESAPAALALAKARADLEQLRGVLTEDHPRVQALAAQVETLQKTLGTELQPVVGQRVVARHPQRDVLENGLLDAEASQQAARQRERAYSAMMETTKHELADLIRLEGKASELITVLELAEKHYSDAEAAVGRAEDIARTRTTGLSLASSATAPLEPLPGRRRMLVAAAVPFFLLLLAITLVLIFHLRGLRTSSSREIAFWGDGPVLMAATWPARARTVADACTDLRGQFTGRDGSTLIVPFSDVEVPLAKELFECLQSDQKTKGGKNGKERAASDPQESPASQGDIIPDHTLALWQQGDESALRRACRNAARVLVVIKIRTHSHFSVYRLKTRLGREHGLGFVVVDVDRDLANMPDRVGDLEDFWASPTPSAIS